MFLLWKSFFFKHLQTITNKLAQKINTFLQIEMINHKITTHICSNCLNNINKGKRPQYQVPYNISRNKMISSIRKLTHLEKQLIFPWLAFVQIYNLHGYGQYKI
jgi:hypothetical protein